MDMKFVYHKTLRKLPEKMYNFVSGPNFRFNLISYIRETVVFISYLLIDVVVIGPLLAKGN